jgi:hypothetical protein
MNRKAALFLLFIALSAFLIEASAQSQTIYLDAGFQRIKENIATYKVPLARTGENTYTANLSFNGIVKMTGHYMPFGITFIEHGEFQFFHANGKLESKGNYERGARVGVWKRFDDKGNSKPDRYYSPEGAENIRLAMGISIAPETKN